jgi:hypothetical protein
MDIKNTQNSLISTIFIVVKRLLLPSDFWGDFLRVLQPRIASTYKRNIGIHFAKKSVFCHHLHASFGSREAP